jgi:hypothetical protein
MVTPEMMGEGPGPRPVRILGEVLIIVAGVLIALGAEEVREDWSERALLAAYMGSLATDLRADLADFDWMLEPTRLPAQLEATDSLVAILSDPERDPPDAIILSYFRAQILLPFAKKRRGTFEDLVGSGRLELIDNPDLRRELVEYYAGPVVTDQSGYDAYLATIFYPFWNRLMLRLGVGRFTAMTACDVIVGSPEETTDCYEAASEGDELDLLRGDPELSALVGAQVLQANFALEGIKQARQQVVLLLRYIDGR